MKSTGSCFAVVRLKRSTSFKVGNLIYRCGILRTTTKVLKKAINVWKLCWRTVYIRLYRTIYRHITFGITFTKTQKSFFYLTPESISRGNPLVLIFCWCIFIDIVRMLTNMASETLMKMSQALPFAEFPHEIGGKILR